MNNNVGIYRKYKILSFILYFVFFNVLSIYCRPTISASAPREVGVGQQFELTYSLVDVDGNNLQIPSIDNYFSILSGPINCSNSQISFINGKLKQSSSVSVKYLLQAKQKGTFKIPSAKVLTKGGKIYSNSLRIKVVSANHTQNNNQGGGGLSNFFNMPIDPFEEGVSKTSRLLPKDYFLKIDVNKKNVYELENFCATLNLYVSDAEWTKGYVIPPQMTGLLSENIFVDAQKEAHLSNVNGKTYRVFPLYRAIVTPTKPGKFTISNGVYKDAIVCLSDGQQVKHDFKSNSVAINVNRLPKRPSGFSDAVGNYSINSELIPKTNFHVGEALTFRIKINGSGNLKSLSPLIIPNIKELESFGVKPINQFKITETGCSGTKYFDYSFVPLSVGSVRIPSISMVYFDPRSGIYKTIKTEPLKFYVSKGLSTSTIVSKQGHNSLSNSDINFIKIKDVESCGSSSDFWGSSKFWILLLTPLLLFVVGYIILYKRGLLLSNEALLKRKTAKKNAIDGLKNSHSLINDPTKFYENIFKILNEYISDKLNIPISCLTEDSLSQYMSTYKVNDELIKEFLSLYKHCEFFSYSPVSDNTQIEDFYNRSISIIENIDDSLNGVL